MLIFWHDAAMKIQTQPLLDLIEHFGNVSATARAFGLDRQEVQRWQNKGFIPFRQGERAEKLTAGKVKAVDIWRAAAARHH